MLVDLLLYYTLGAIITYIYCWLKPFPLVLALIREYGIATGNEKVYSAGFVNFQSILGWFIGTWLIWWVTGPYAIFNQDKFIKAVARGAIQTLERQ